MRGEHVPSAHFTLSPDDFTFIGQGLNRPECVVELDNGQIVSGDWDGGVAIVDANGGVRKIIAKSVIFGEPLKPNGVAVNPDGSFLVTHLSEEHGGVFRLDRDGGLEEVLVQVDGIELPPTNFVLRDALGRIWITVSTRLVPRYRARTIDHADGFIVLLDDRGARIVADNLGFTNEVRLDASGRFLYVNETFGRRLTRFVVSPIGELLDRTTVSGFGPGTFPDGLTLDAEGGFWITSVFSNRIIRILPSGESRIVFEDCDQSYIGDIEEKFMSGQLARERIKGVKGRVLGNISSLVFTGTDRKNAILGCLDDARLACFRSPVAGARQ